MVYKLFDIIFAIMKTLFWAIIIGYCLCLIQCKSIQKNQKSSSQVEVNTQKVRLKVSFISIGEGINFEAAKYFPKVIENFNKEKKVRLEYVMVPWGREGEFNYCFYEQKKIEEFIPYAQKEMSRFENVLFQENPFHCDR